MTGSGVDLSSIEVKSNKSKSSKKSSERKSVPRPNVQQVESEDISLSQLELMANRKKMVKQNETLPEIIKEMSLENVKPKKKKTHSVSTVSSLASSSESESKKRRRDKIVAKENKSEAVRMEKNELLFKFSKMNIKQKWSSLKLDMNYTLDEIRNECDRVRSAMQAERSISFYKRMMLLGVQGIEMMNNKFDPLGVDLDGWSEAMGYSLENQDYDEVMAELVEKYKGAGNMSPEMKLIFMVIGSATMFTVSKKISKLDSSNGFTNLIGSLVGAQPAQPNYQQPQQQAAHQQAASAFFQQQQQARQPVDNFNLPSAAELRQNYADTTEDASPSKMKGPSNIVDENELANILQKMEKSKEGGESIGSDDVFKSIDLKPTKKGGRPRKSRSKVSKI